MVKMKGKKNDFYEVSGKDLGKIKLVLVYPSSTLL